MVNAMKENHATLTFQGVANLVKLSETLSQLSEKLAFREKGDTLGILQQRLHKRAACTYVALVWLRIPYIRESVLERSIKPNQPLQEFRPLDSFFESFRIQQWAFDKIVNETPFPF